FVGGIDEFRERRFVEASRENLERRKLADAALLRLAAHVDGAARALREAKEHAIRSEQRAGRRNARRARRFSARWWARGHAVARRNRLGQRAERLGSACLVQHGSGRFRELRLGGIGTRRQARALRRVVVVTPEARENLERLHRVEAALVDDLEQRPLAIHQLEQLLVVRRERWIGVEVPPLAEYGNLVEPGSAEDEIFPARSTLSALRHERRHRVANDPRTAHRFVGNLEGALAECEDAKQRRLATEHAHFRIQEMSLTEPYGRCPRWGLETHDRRTAARFERGQKVGDGDAGYLAAQCRS